MPPLKNITYPLENIWLASLYPFLCMYGLKWLSSLANTLSKLKKSTLGETKFSKTVRPRASDFSSKI